jgi:hypothetical protein
MADVLDYLDWRSDIPFSQVPINEVDALILARFAYIRFENYIPKSLDIYTTIEELAKRFDWDNERYLLPQDKPLFEKLSRSVRFKDMHISGFISKLHEENEEQFCAVCFEAPEFTYIAFRGTDNTLIGWKEDFNMSFMKNIPSQIDALEYVNEAAKQKDKIILGGHSKGGNLAMYAGIFTQADILGIYNFDGPGFVSSIIQTEAFQNRSHLIQSYFPQSSFIGMLLDHPESYWIIKSSSNGPYSHDIFTWLIMSSQIVKAEKMSIGSRFLVETLENWMKETPPEERQNMVDTIYDMLVDKPSDTVVQWKSKWYSTLKNTLSQYKQMDSNSRDQITESIIQLLNSARTTFIEHTKKGED